jgi:HSP20 family protein
MFYRRLFNVPKGGFTSAFHELDRMKRQMDNLFDALSGRSSARPTAGVFPLTNVTEDKDNYYLRAELPGIKADDLDIQVTKNGISITAVPEKYLLITLPLW